MKEFKYDVVQLIEGVRDRPCLWDKTLENYKDRVERRTAWEEIFCILDERYEDMTHEEKRLTGEHVLNKWTNIRDTFVKSLKTKLGKPKRKYVLYNHLKFLTKILPEEEGIEYTEDYSNPTTYITDETVERERSTSKKRSKREENDEEYVPSAVPSKSKDDYKFRKRTKKSEYIEEDVFPSRSNRDETNDLDFVEVDESHDPRIMNEDEAFFASLLPTIVKYSEDERLEFRIEVLGIMKRIKDSRKWNNDGMVRDCT